MDVLKPEIPVRISNVALFKAPESGEPVRVFMKFDQGEYLICTLTSRIRNVKVDLLFDEKDQVTFRITGGIVHLSGNVEAYDDDYESVDSNVLRENRDGSSHCQGDSDSEYEDVKEAARRLDEMRARRERGSRRSRIDNYRLGHRKDL